MLASPLFSFLLRCGLFGAALGASADVSEPTYDFEALRQKVFGSGRDIVVVTQGNGRLDLPESRNELGIDVFVFGEGVVIGNVGRSLGQTRLFAFAPSCFERSEFPLVKGRNISLLGPYRNSMKEINGLFLTAEDTKPKPPLTVEPSAKCNSRYFFLPTKFKLRKCAGLQAASLIRDEWVILEGTENTSQEALRAYGETCPYTGKLNLHPEHMPSWVLMGEKFKEEAEIMKNTLIEEGADFSTSSDYPRGGIPHSNSPVGQLVLVNPSPSLSENPHDYFIENACTNEALCVIINNAGVNGNVSNSPVPVALDSSTLSRKVIFDFGEGVGKIMPVSRDQLQMPWE